MCPKGGMAAHVNMVRGGAVEACRWNALHEVARLATLADALEVKGAFIDADGVEHVVTGKVGRSENLHRKDFP